MLNYAKIEHCKTLSVSLHLSEFVVHPWKLISSAQSLANHFAAFFFQVFKKKIQEFREACYALTGYKVDVTRDNQYRLQSMYAERSTDDLLFEVNTWCVGATERLGLPCGSKTGTLELNTASRRERRERAKYTRRARRGRHAMPGNLLVACTPNLARASTLFPPVSVVEIEDFLQLNWTLVIFCFLWLQSTPKGEMMLLATDFSSQLTDQIDTYLTRFNSIPAFLSSITLELFNRQTQTIVINWRRYASYRNLVFAV